MIDQLVEQVCSKLGLPADKAEQAVGVVMGFFKKEGDPAVVTDMFAKIPGAADLAGKYESLAGGQAAAGGGGLLGGLMSKITGSLGGGAGDALEAVQAFKQTGLSMDQAQELLPVAKNFLEENAGSDLVGKALESVPALKSLLK